MSKKYVYSFGPGQCEGDGSQKNLLGGKGANQALAAHRLGGDVKFVTCLGNDANGQNTLQYYRQEGLDVSAGLIVKDTPTGTAMILVNNEGENCIIITPGANHKLSPDHIQRIEKEIALASANVTRMPTTVHKRTAAAAMKPSAATPSPAN